MKKTLCLLLAVLLVACSLPAIITSYAEDSVNLLANATYANGDVTWTTTTDVNTKVGNIEAWGDYQGVSTRDNTERSVNGGYSWTFGMGDGRVGGNTNNPTDPNASPWPLYNFEEHKDVYAYVYIKVSGLKIGEKYEFSYYYQNDYIIDIASIKTSGGDIANFSTPTTENGSKARSYKVSTIFTAPVNGDYVIALKTNRSNRTSDCAWSNVILSDLVLIKTEAAVNLLKSATYANGDVSWTTSTNVDNRVGNIDSWGVNDNTDRSVNGGYSWTFGLGDGKVGGDNTYTEAKYKETYAYVYIKAKNLTAGARYDFSFIYQGDYAIALESIADSSSTKVEPELAAKDVAISGGENAHQVVTTFVAPTAGDYTITLKTNRNMHITGRGWSNVILSDLILSENTEPKKVTAEVLVSGNGTATVSDKLPAEGSEVTFTAVAYPDEDFLGWYNGDQKVSDKAEYTVIANESITLTAKFTSKNLNVLAGKKASDWEGYRWTQIEDSNESRNGGQGYLAKDVMWQSMYTKVTLKPDTEYGLSFNWKSVTNSVCPAYPANIMVYAADDVDINDRYNNWSDHGESGLFQPKTGVDLEQGSGYATEELAKTYEWQNISTSFTTKGNTEYYIIIYFSINGGANNQGVNLSDFILQSMEKEVTSISDKDASEWSCFEWSSIENSDVSRYGGKGYLVKKAMYQNIFTSVELKPNTKYRFSFEWKAVANAKGPVFPNDIFVVAKDDIDMWDTKNPNVWDPANGFKGGAYDLEKGGIMNVADKAATLEWQSTTVNFTTKEQTEYSLLIHFQASDNGEQEIYISDLKMEEVGPVEPEGGEVVGENLAANYTNANGHVTWDSVAGAWGTDGNGESYQDNKSYSVYGGYSWTFGLPDSHFEDNPSYVTIKTDSLQANRKYEFSYIYQADYIIVFDSITPDVEIVNSEDVKLLEGDRAHRITTQFTTSKAGPVTIKLKMGKYMNNEGCNWSITTLSDLNLCDITDRIYGSVKSELGGSVSGFDADYCTRGDEITITATPLSGNTFEGWFDAEGNKVSADAVYTFTAQSDFNLLAKFSGSNIPNSEWLSLNGMDGTFENGSMLGWKAEDRDRGDDTSWAMFDRSTDYSYNGDYSLKMRARYRTSFFKFSNLKKSTNYFLSFYVNHPDLFIPQTSEDQEKSEYNNEAVVRWFGVTASVNGAALYSESGSQGAPAIKGGSGWYKVNIYFNTGDYTDVDWNLYYTNKDKCDIEFLYIDDVSLIEYTSNEFENGDFANGAASWRGDFTVEDGVGKGKSFYQNVNLGTQTLYTVTFKAKGKGVGGASLLTNKAFDVHSQISSQSAVEVNSNEWKTYSFDVYTGVNPDVSLFFKADEGEFMVDDVTITKAVERNGAIVEKVDFESERFALHEKSDVFEIYEGTVGDANVHSGTKSLRFNSANAEEGVSYIFTEGFLSTQVVSKLNYRLTLYYKTAKGNSVYLAPEFLPEDTVKTVYTAAGNGWTKVDFIFNKLSLSYIKTIIGNVLGKTTADFYVDDITLTIAPPMVTETNSANKYCEWPLNVLNNQGFEDKITNNDWANLPKTAEIRTDKGAAGDNYLRLKAGTRYILPVKVEASDNYYFAISTRLGKNSSGYVAVASDSEGKKLYTDIDGNPVSKITVDSAKWSRDAYLFSTGESGFIYLVFVVEKGYIDVDEVAVYKRQYGMEEDLNDHTKFVPYNYDNPDPSTVVLNGGDSTFEGNEITEESESPETGDNRTTPATVLVITTFAAMLLVATTKRTRKISKGGKA